MNNVTKAGSTEKKTAAKMGTNKGAGKAVTTDTATRRSTGKATPATSRSPTRTVSAEEREKMIAQAAYLRAEQRGFTGGDPVADWLEAEAEVDSRLSQSSH